ncbi:iduronate sulfatase [Rhodopirellula sp. SM50]|nr:sulfatase [Rhodopirellula sp. SM50]PAY17115.1 iduronate sulfatase [Rhodopirellula sp. SM50]
MERSTAVIRSPFVLTLAIVLLPMVTVWGDVDRPNLLFIISDDLNTALSGMGHPECNTPHLDEFAKSGVMFTRTFCQFPLCGPSRASMMSGQYPLVNGVTGNGGNVDPERVTLPRHFANHGYWTGRVSKIYHMGIPVDIVEGNPGRDHAGSWDETHNIAALEALTPGKAEDFANPDTVAQFPEERRKWLAAHAGGKRYRFSKVARAQYASIEVEEKNQHLLADSMAADKAIELLQMRAGQAEPFFLAVGLVRPHFPFIATEKTIGQYNAEKLVVPNVPPGDHEDIPSQAMGSVLEFDRSPIQKMRRAYYGAVSFMDRQVGRIIAELDRLKLRDNTIVVFVSDHGYLLGEHHMWKKSKLWEEAIRVPLIISAPSRKQGVRCQHFVELVDLYPTLTELAGLPAEPHAQGQSLVPLLDDPLESLSKTDAMIQVGAGFGLRSGKWAWMWYPASKNNQDGFMLYDMEKDPEQYTNLVDDPKHDSIRKQLHTRLLKRIEIAGN